MFKIIGKKPSGKLLEKIKQSPNYKKEGFENLSETPMMLQGISYFGLIKKTLNKNPDTKPPSVLPSVKTGLKNIAMDKPCNYLVWALFLFYKN